MILKGSTRTGAIDLALHLSNALDNERVHIGEIKGAVADNLYDVFREWQLVSEATKCTKPFYSLSINPDPNQRDWTDKDWQIAIESLERNLGLKGQPRAVVFHEKVGEAEGRLRRHCHVVWSRIRITDDGQLKAAHMGNDRYILKRCAHELAQELKLTLRFGKTQQQGYDLAKSQGRNRDLDTARERKEKLTKAWQAHHSAKAFEIAARDEGYILAQGDKRGFVVVDRDGQVHSLSRQLDKVRGREITQRLGDPKTYPNVEQAKGEWRVIQEQDRQAWEQELQRQQQSTRINLTREQALYAKLKRMARRADKLHVKRRRELADQQQRAKQAQETQLLKLQAKFQRESEAIAHKRAEKKSKGLKQKLQTLIGYDLLLKWKQAHQDRQRLQEHEKSLQALKKAYRQEQERLKKLETRLKQQETREAHSMAKLAQKLNLQQEKLRQSVKAQELEPPALQMQLSR